MQNKVDIFVKPCLIEHLFVSKLFRLTFIFMTEILQCIFFEKKSSLSSRPVLNLSIASETGSQRLVKYEKCLIHGHIKMR